jgi:hypothetical protein
MAGPFAEVMIFRAAYTFETSTGLEKRKPKL